MKKHDVIIIGAGPIGLACGVEAEKHKMTSLTIEKGCLVNSIYRYPKNMTFFSTSDRLEIGNVPFISHGNKPTRTEALEYYRRVKESWGLNVRTYETVNSVTGEYPDFIITTSKDQYRSKNVIVSTGFFDEPNLLGIQGENLSKVKHYYDEPHPYAFQKIVVIGGGNSAVDVALETFRRGSDVTMVIKKNNLDEGVKYWVRPDIENRLKDGSVKSYFNSTVKEIREHDVVIKTPDGVITIGNDFVLAMTGYHPDFSFLESLGIQSRDEITKEPNYDEESFETNVKGIFVAGVVCCGYETRKWFIENSRYHAVNIFRSILDR
ncbi:MAG: YpdA family putative bacillithiol disulfide reductase [Melioribacteraceae bacterium]|nr:YpdA family putative bacillithiol disulfide reductase [Melioribacteraceae bacterium]